MAVRPGEPPAPTDRLPDALDHTWKWFSYHAQQRLTAFNFYLVIVGVVTVGYLKCLEQGWQYIGAVVAGFGAIISLAFWFLDVRNTELVNCGREALRELEPQFDLKIRKMDDDRKSLMDAIGGPRWLRWIFGRPDGGTLVPRSGTKFLTRHQWWLRAILVIGFAAFVVASFLTAYGFPDVSPRSRVAPEYLLRRVDRMMMLLSQLDSTSKEKPVTLGSARVMRDVSLSLMLLSQQAGSDCRLERKVGPACTQLRAWSTRANPVFQQLSIYDGAGQPPVMNPTLSELMERLDDIVDLLRGSP